MPWVVSEKGEVSKTGCKNDGKYKFLILVTCTGKMQDKGRYIAVPRAGRKKKVRSEPFCEKDRK